jgi:prevent-host-death family protein
MITLPLAEAKNRFSELVTRVQNGEQVSVTRRGKPVVSLIAAIDPPPQQSQQACVAEVFHQLAQLSHNRGIEGDMKALAREGLD